MGKMPGSGLVLEATPYFSLLMQWDYQGAQILLARELPHLKLNPAECYPER